MSDFVWNVCLLKWRRGKNVWRVRLGWTRPGGIPWDGHLGRLSWTMFYVADGDWYE